MNYSKQLLYDAILGNTPSYKAMEITIIAKLGVYSGGFNDRWDWNKHTLSLLTEDQLLKIYTLLKE